MPVFLEERGDYAVSKVHIYVVRNPDSTHCSTRTGRGVRVCRGCVGSTERHNGYNMHRVFSDRVQVGVPRPRLPRDPLPRSAVRVESLRVGVRRSESEKWRGRAPRAPGPGQQSGLVACLYVFHIGVNLYRPPRERDPRRSRRPRTECTQLAYLATATPPACSAAGRAHGLTST